MFNCSRPPKVSIPIVLPRSPGLNGRIRRAHVGLPPGSRRVVPSPLLNREHAIGPKEFSWKTAVSLSKTKVLRATFFKVRNYKKQNAKPEIQLLFRGYPKNADLFSKTLSLPNATISRDAPLKNRDGSLASGCLQKALTLMQNRYFCI